MSQEHGQLTVAVRGRTGKGAARQLRRAGRIPAVLYGRGHTPGGEPVLLSLSPHELRRALDPQRKLNTLFQLTIQEPGRPDRQEPCVITEAQLDAVQDRLVHVDFLRVDPREPVTLEVPVEYSGRAVGVVAGGELRTLRRSVRVAARPADIPVCLHVDVTPLQVGQSLRVRDVPLEGGRVVENPDTVLALVEVAKKEPEEKPEGEPPPPESAA